MPTKSAQGDGARGKSPGGTKKAAPKTAAEKKRAVPAKKSPARETKLKLPPKTAPITERLAVARKMEKLDAQKPTPEPTATRGAAARTSANPFRNRDFPNTYIKEINVALDDPDHTMTFTWTGPQAASQEKGPFRTSPGAGLTGLNCDLVTTSQRSGSNCTPKGEYLVEGFAPHLPSHREATNVTWFLIRRGIALHFYPSVPKFAASHGCVRVEQERVAKLIQDNARIGRTKVIVGGKWTKPPRQH